MDCDYDYKYGRKIYNGFIDGKSYLTDEIINPMYDQERKQKNVFTHTLINGSKSIYDMVKKNSNAKVLLLNRCDLVSLNFDEFGETKLEIIELKHNYLEKIIGTMPNTLVEFVCVDNKLTCLDNLPSGLKYLNCSKNKLVNLNMLPCGLEILVCNYNKLVSLDMLPDGLVYLECYDNFITKLDDLPSSLEELHAYSNKISSIGMIPKKLKILYCQYNNLKSLNGITPDLTELYCNSNQLEEISFPPNSKMLKLKISNNKIKSIEGIPSGIKYIDISHNPIEIIPSIPNGDCEIIS